LKRVTKIREIEIGIIFVKEIKQYLPPFAITEYRHFSSGKQDVLARTYDTYLPHIGLFQCVAMLTINFCA
jgi:hypothetical protein